MGEKNSFLKSIDQQCGTTNNMTGLSLFTSTTSGVLMLLTIPLNSIIIYCLVNERKKKYKSLLYKLLLNIAMADLMTGLVPDPFLVNSVTKEALKIKLSLFEIYGIHLSLLYTDAVALLTLAVLSIERFIALVFPVVHAGGVRKRNEIILVVSVWLLAVLIVLPYLKIQFIRQLLIFSSVNIVFAVVSLIITTVTYKYKLRPAITNMRRINSKIFFRKNASVNVIEPNRHLRNKQKVTRTFILMLVVFLFTYLPAVITIMYMNFCGKECN